MHRHIVSPGFNIYVYDKLYIRELDEIYVHVYVISYMYVYMQCVCL